MRRLIAYITMAISMLIAIGVSATPVLTNLNYGREFSKGREVVFKIESDEDIKEGAVDEVAKEMRTRLDNFNIEDYSVKIQGNDTVTASFACDSKEFNYIAKYLCFSGEDFALSTNNDETLRKNLLDTENARIEYEQDTIPVVVIPLAENAKSDVETIINSLSAESGDTSGTTKSIKRAAENDHDHDHDEDTQEQKMPDIFLWANFEEGVDSYADIEENPIVREKIIMSFYASNIWYTNSDEEETELAFTCATATDDNQLDLSGLKDDVVRAKYLLNMLQASKYDYEITCPTRNIRNDQVDYYTNALEVVETSEPLLSFGNNVNIAMSTTLVATLIAIVIVSLLLVVYYRLAAVGMVATSLSTVYLTIVAFRSMNVLFNIPALIGFIILAAGTLFGEIVYVNRFKEEIYKGRAIKKANQEASKKSNLLTLDATVIMAFAGLMMYVLGGTALKPLGVTLFFGGIFALIMNLITFKILMYLVANTTSLQNKYNAFNVDGNKVPNLMSNEVKEAYVGPYEKVNFTKSKNVMSVLFGALTIAAATFIIIFGIKDGSPLNVNNATKDTTVIYTALKQSNNIVSDTESFKEYALKGLIEDNTISEDKMTTEMKVVYDLDFSTDEKVETVTNYFVTTINESYDEEKLDVIQNAISDSLEDYSLISVEAKNSKELIYTPDQGLVALATGLSIVGAALYAAFRFGPSRGIGLLTVSGGSTAIAYGLFVALRVGTTAITSLAMPLVAMTSILSSWFFLATEKAIRKETKTEMNAETRKEVMKASIGKAAAPILVFMLVTVYVAINYFGFGLHQTTYLFGSVLVGDIISAVIIFVVFGPLFVSLSNAFSKISLPKFKFAHKEKVNIPHKHNSSEPEETIFIGIND